MLFSCMLYVPDISEFNDYEYREYRIFYAGITGYLQSPGYPTAYQPYTDETVKIEAPVGKV